MKKKDFIKDIRRRMQIYNLNQDQLAKITEMTPANLSRILNKESEGFGADTFLKICSVLDLDANKYKNT